MYVSYEDLEPDSNSPASPGRVRNWVYTFYGKINKGWIGHYGALKHSIDQYVYIGDFKNKKISGKGWYRNLKTKDEYEGDFENGAFNGKGTLTGIDFILEGSFKNNKLEGEGKITSRHDSSTWEGNFVNGKEDGVFKVVDAYWIVKEVIYKDGKVVKK